ncbi:MAG: cupin [Prochlorotrichaceae cyanobacterium]|jgi:predicted metal-dependent enzyme (double-stranded beta helix superfamily)
MNSQDWFVDETGTCQPRPAARTWDLLREHYYLHQFLTEILDTIAKASNELEEWDYLPQIRRKVRQLLINSYWVRTQHGSPDIPTGSHVFTLYDEIGYPLTIQNVTTKPGIKSSIHNHGTWGVVFQISGQEKHTFWRKINTPEESFRIEKVGEHILEPGEIISFHPDAIHQAETIGEENGLSFQLYGDTQPKSRFQFELETQTARRF